MLEFTGEMPPRLFVVLFIITIAYSHEYNALSIAPTDFWDETEPFSQSGSPSPGLRLPASVVPSFYRLKIKADLESSNFTGEVFITLHANKKVKEIILHAKNLSIGNKAKLTEQIYEKVETLHSRRKRQEQEPVLNQDNANNETESAKVTEIAPEKFGDVENAAGASEPANIANVVISNNSISESNVTENLLKIDASKSDNNTVPVERTSSENTTEENNNITSLTEPVITNVIDKKESTTSSPIEENANIDTQTQVTHSNVRDIKIISISAAEGDRLILSLATPIKPGVDYILEIPFEGQISSSMTGFYRSEYVDEHKQKKSLAVTQFEPVSARAAFPCFDEPGFKAKFEISIAHRKNLTALSNMKVAATEEIADQPDWVWTHFERSVNMSTYLVAYVICDFVSLETNYVSKDNITKPIRVWTRPELINKATYASKIVPALLTYYEEVFGVPYALEKMDLIAIPDFGSGAMENWGLITFRETTLLFDEEHSVPRDKQNVAINIAHELAHQWFGNLVTMQWWTDLWLNEGFATYIEYLGVDHIEPRWDMLEAFTKDMIEHLRSDALKNTSPVSRKVIDASEISQKFDEISYTKGANLIRMLNHTITEELFHKGLVYYLDQWKYSNAEENDLWEAMSTAVSTEPAFAGRSLVAFMNSWTRQAGYPVVSAKRDYDTGLVHFDQKLFTSSKEPYKHMLENIWQIPISWTTVDAPAAEWTSKPKLWLVDKDTTATLPINSSQALYVNVGAIGYYRVNYDQKNWELLSKALKSGHVQSPITKAQLIDDAFNLAKANQLNYSYALGLTTYVIDGEDSKIVWDLLLNNMAFLMHNLKSTSGYIYFQDYIKILIKKQLEQLNYGLNKPKDDNEAFLVENLVMWECMVEAPRCLNWAKEEFEKWVAMADHSDNPIPSHLRSLVFHMALKHGGRREFEFLWNIFQNSTDPNVKTQIINALPSTKEENLITMLLEKSVTEIPKQYAISVWSFDPPVGTAIAQRFVFDNFMKVYSTFTEMDEFMFQNVLIGAFGFISTEDDLNKLKSFALEHKEKLMPMSQTLQKIVDTAKLRIEWMRTHAADINRWLKNYVTGGMNAISETTSEGTLMNIVEGTKQENSSSQLRMPDAIPQNNLVPQQDAPKTQNNETVAQELPSSATELPKDPENSTVLPENKIKEESIDSSVANDTIANPSP